MEALGEAKFVSQLPALLSPSKAAFGYPEPSKILDPARAYILPTQAHIHGGGGSLNICLLSLNHALEFRLVVVIQACG